MKRIFKPGFASILLLVVISCRKENINSAIPTAIWSDKNESLTTSVSTANSLVADEVVYNTIPAHIEAEKFESMSGVQIETCSEGGQDVKYFPGGWTNYTLSVTTAGTYTFHLRVASATGGQLQLLFGSASVNAYATIPPTGSSQTWRTVTLPVTLQAGKIMMSIINKSGEFGINHMKIPKPIFDDADADG